MARHLTYFGVPVPVFRIEKLGAGAFTVRFVLKGRIVSKKNHQQAVARRKEAKQYLYDISKQRGQISLQEALRAVDMVQAKMIGNIEYNAFLKQFKPVIEEQKRVWIERLGKKGLKFPLRKASMSLKLFFADRYVTDTVNKQQSIQDLLVDCGVLINDDRATLNPISAGSMSCYQKMKENVCFISLSFKIEETKDTG